MGARGRETGNRTSKVAETGTPWRKVMRAMSARPWDRERVLAMIWLSGALLTALTMVLPYEADVNDPVRAGVAVSALICGLALLKAPPLPEWALHAILVGGALTISVCTSLGMADVEGVMYLLPVLFAFAAFRPLLGAAHLGLASVAYAVVLATAADERTVAPWVSLTLVMGVGAVVGTAIAVIVASREHAVRAGARDRRIAEVLQRSLLPEALPVAPGIGLAARYVPAAEEADVGGDLYDVLVLPGGRIAAAIGDVAGKGLPAAAMVGRTRSALRAYALDDPAPARVLDRLNRLMTSDPIPARMTTLLYAVADPEEGTLTWCAAGHLPPLLVGAKGSPRYLEGVAGVPLGVVPLARYEQSSAPLEPGDRLLMFTDGLVERRGEPIDEGLQALAEHVAATARTGAEALVEAALAGAHGAGRDDVAVLAIALAPIGDRLVLDVPSRPEALADVRLALRRWAAPRLLAGGVEDLLLACSEITANAIVHAGPAPSVRVEAQARPGRLTVRISDDGCWRTSVEDDHGYGLTLARELSDRFDVRTAADGTVVELEFSGDRVRTGAPVAAEASAG